MGVEVKNNYYCLGKGDVIDISITFYIVKCVTSCNQMSRWQEEGNKLMVKMMKRKMK